VAQRDLGLLERWYPSPSAEIRGYASFDAWKHVERCDFRWLLLGRRRGVVEAENAARNQRRVSESATECVMVADGTAVAELPPTTNSSSSDGGEVAAASVPRPRKRPR
jgi:hypothetical protein